MKTFKLIYKPFNEKSILIEWPKRIEEEILIDIVNFKQKIKHKKLKQIANLNQSYNSLLVNYNYLETNIAKEVSILKTIYETELKSIQIKPRLWKIPVCYDTIFGLDLQRISSEKNITIQTIINQHSKPIYTVYFIGFLPGFLYLGGLDESLHVPRKINPRLKIESGAVGIGGKQTGVYPIESPGGWNIIGNSPINFFNINNTIPCFAQPGDYIKFYPITVQEHKNIKALVAANVYQLENEVISG